MNYHKHICIAIYNLRKIINKSTNKNLKFFRTRMNNLPFIQVPTNMHTWKVILLSRNNTILLNSEKIITKQLNLNSQYEKI